jgi:hypothetical protein
MRATAEGTEELIKPKPFPLITSRDTLMDYLFGGLPDVMSFHTVCLRRKSKLANSKLYALLARTRYFRCSLRDLPMRD